MIKVEKTVAIYMGFQVAEELSCILTSALMGNQQWNPYTIGIADINRDLKKIIEEENPDNESS